MADGQLDAQPRTLKDYVRPVVNDNYSGIRCQTINANNFELKPALISMVQRAQFSGLPIDDPNIHLVIFLEICHTLKINGVTEDTIRLRLFPFSLRDKARGWLQSLQLESITSWQNMAENFLAKFFQPAKTAQLMSEIGQFKQNDFESLYEAWEGYKNFIRRCPQHGFPDWLQVQMFYNGLNEQTRTIVDAASGGTLMSKTVEGATSLFEEMASNNYQWSTERTMAKKVVGIHELEPLAALLALVVTLSHQISALTTQRIPQSAEYITATSMTIPSNEASQEQVQYINNQYYNYRGNPMPNYYHLGLRNHENLSKLGLGEMKQTTISLQLVDRSIKYPCGIIEDVLVTSLSNEVGRLEPMLAKIDSMNSKEKMQQTTTPELKQLPEHLCYSFWGDAYENAKIYKEQTKKWHDKQILRREFAPGQQVV
ncbi:uncharacterized protein [Aristolochia californica]|uniref:uncharacterized protein n=1 Tax=Aristolochia californica TaxID=171875 RepID=UPI0035E03F69